MLIQFCSWQSPTCFVQTCTERTFCFCFLVIMETTCSAMIIWTEARCRVCCHLRSAAGHFSAANRWPKAARVVRYDTEPRQLAFMFLHASGSSYASGSQLQYIQAWCRQLQTLSWCSRHICYLKLPGVLRRCQRRVSTYNSLSAGPSVLAVPQHQVPLNDILALSKNWMSRNMKNGDYGALFCMSARSTPKKPGFQWAITYSILLVWLCSGSHPPFHMPAWKA